MKYEIKNRFTGAVLVVAEIDCRADLRKADLRGADLGGANLGGANLGGMVIIAGCRTWIGADAIERARDHCQTDTHDLYRKEALSIVDHIERMAI